MNEGAPLTFLSGAGNVAYGGGQSGCFQKVAAIHSYSPV